MIHPTSFENIPFTHAPLEMLPQWKELSNGLKYIVSEEIYPKNQVSIELIIHVGQLHETEDQKGLTHFIEHMAFHVNENLRDFLAQHGVEFGPDLNASTHYDKTIYKLYGLPTQDLKILKEIVEMLYEMVFCITFPEDKVELEKGIVLREMKERLPILQTEDLVINNLYPNCSFSEMNSPKELEVIEGTKKSQLEYLYKLYRADRANLVVVGDIDPLLMENWIEEIFNKAAPPVEPFPIQLNFPVHNDIVHRLGAISFQKNKNPSFHVYYKNREITKWNQEKIEEGTVKKIAFQIVKTRVRHILDENSSIKEVYFVSRFNFFNAKCNEIQFLSETTSFLQIFQTYLHEIKSIEHYGISDDEFLNAKNVIEALALKKLLNIGLEKKSHLKTLERFRSHCLIQMPTHKSKLKETINSLKRITDTKVKKALKRYYLWSPNMHFGFYGESLPSVNEIKRKYLQPLSIKNRIKNNANPFFGISPAEEVSLIEYKHHCEIELKEGSRIFFYPRKGDVRLAGISPSGCDQYSLTRKEIVSLIIINSCFTAMAFPGFSPTDMQNLMSCSAFGFPKKSINSLTQNITGTIEPHNAETLFKFFHVLLSEPNILNNQYCKNRFELVKKSIVEGNKEKGETSRLKRDDLEETLFKLEEMFDPNLDSDDFDINELTYDDVLEVFYKYRASPRSYNFILVGNLSKEEVVDLTSRYLMNLPSKAINATKQSSLHKFQEVKEQDFNIKCLNINDDSKIVFSFSYMYLQSLVNSELFNLTLDIVRKVLREEIRHKLGAIYDIEIKVSVSGNKQGYQYGYFRVSTITSQEFSPQFKGVFFKTIKKLLRDDETLLKLLDKEIKYKAKKIQSHIKTSSVLFDALQQYFIVGIFEDPHNYSQDVLKKITLDELKNKIKELFLENKNSFYCRTIA